MAQIVFYEKPGCINNTRQKQLLEAAGHQLDVRNLLTEPWTVERLRHFFDELPIPEWFNRSAPRIKSGEVVPEQCTADEALAQMLADPLLIRRPLMLVGMVSRIGFDQEAIRHWIGLADELADDNELEVCPRMRLPAQAF